MKHKKLQGTARIILLGAATVFLCAMSILFLTPIVLTLTNSFMSQTEIASNYGKIFDSVTSAGTYVSDKVNLKIIPDLIRFSQYETVLLKSPDYLFKFWNSVILVVPIVLFQTLVALLAAYGFARFDTKWRNAIFFTYIILMLMPYQVTLVPNYLVADWLGILDTRWAIILPGIFSLCRLHTDQVYAAHPLLGDRGRQAGRRRRVADFHEDLRPHVGRHRGFRGHSGVHRLLEYG